MPGSEGGSPPPVIPPEAKSESSLACRSISSSAPKVQAKKEDALRPDLIAVSISHSHLRGDVRKDAGKQEQIARRIPTTEILFEGGVYLLVRYVPFKFQGN